MQVLVLGGTGPTGRVIVENLLAGGHDVTVYHTGRHETAFSRDVEHIHGSTRETAEMARALEERRFDAAVNTGARVFAVLEALPGRARRLITISGNGRYKNMWSDDPSFAGVPLPVRESDPGWDDLEGHRFHTLVAQGEEAAFRAHQRGDLSVTALRYPLVYGPFANPPHEWYLVRRVLDRRTEVLLPGDGLMLPQRGHVRNLAHAVMLALEHPAAEGKVYNVGDTRALTARRISEVVADALGHRWDLVPCPLSLWNGRNPLARNQSNLCDYFRIRAELGYEDVVDPETGTAEAARWMAAHPYERHGPEEQAMHPQAFDYAAEDAVIAAMRAIQA